MTAAAILRMLPNSDDSDDAAFDMEDDDGSEDV